MLDSGFEDTGLANGSVPESVSRMAGPTHVLRITRGQEVREITLDRPLYKIGREHTDISLPSRRVSRTHAWLYRDPFSRWIIADQNSRHGVWVDQRQVQTVAVSDGQPIAIGPYTLTIEPIDLEPGGDRLATASVAMTCTDAPVTLQEAGQNSSTQLGVEQIQRFNRIAEDLTRAANIKALYQRACQALVRDPSSFAAIVQQTRQQPPRMIEIAAGDAVETGLLQADDSRLVLSSRVIQAISDGRDAVRAADAHRSASDDLALTLSDDVNPRTVFCATITRTERSVEMLYVNGPGFNSDGQELDLITALARQITLLRKSLLFADHRIRHERIERELEMAREIQSRLIPTQAVEGKTFRLSLVYKPAAWVGGDYCDHWSSEDNALGFAVGDVSGKGLPGALVMSNVHAALRTAGRLCHDLESVMNTANEHLIHHLPASMFVSLILGRFQPDTGLLTFVNAGHPLPIICDSSGNLVSAGKTTNSMLGLISESFVAQTVTLQPGDCCYIVTDGVLEAPDENGRRLGPTGLAGMIEQIHRDPEPDPAAHLHSLLQGFTRNAPISDDLTILTIQHLAAEPPPSA